MNVMIFVIGVFMYEFFSMHVKLLERCRQAGYARKCHTYYPYWDSLSHHVSVVKSGRVQMDEMQRHRWLICIDWQNYDFITRLQVLKSDKPTLLKLKDCWKFLQSDLNYDVSTKKVQNISIH